MSDTMLVNRTIEDEYRERTPGSAKLAEEARTLLPSGIAHDARWLQPYTIYVDRASGPLKWDVDENSYIDFYGGHGALLLGHANSEVTKAAAAALAKGTHFGANHPLEIAWSRAVQRLVPSAERIRFTSSGTEATHMAVRLARAFTGRLKIARFKSHFHGWHDHMTAGYTSHFDGSTTPGVLSGIMDHVVLLEPNDEADLRRKLAEDPDIAAVILEPTGGSAGMVPLRPEFVHTVREVTEQHDTLLIFDEVITGFRVSPGGAQAAYGIRPDLSTFAKIIAGGLPGAAVAGRAEILEQLDFAAAASRGFEKIEHPGTFNANPVSAAAGSTALRIIAETDACDRANSTAAQIRARLNEVIAAERLPWACYGTFSMFHLFTNPRGRDISPTTFDPFHIPYPELKEKPAKLLQGMRLALLLEGVDVGSRLSGFVSATHGSDEVEGFAHAFGEAVRRLKRQGVVQPA